MKVSELYDLYADKAKNLSNKEYFKFVKKSKGYSILRKIYREKQNLNLLIY